MPIKPTTSHLELVKSKGGHKPSTPGVLRHIEEQALLSSSQLMDHMFSATDDLFYELSRRATSNNEQNLYFESMREIRIKKDGVIKAFLRDLSQGFGNLITPGAIDGGTYPDDTEDADPTLSLVEGDDLEVELALKSMSGRAATSYKNEIYELTTRLDHLLLQVNVNDHNNPLSPLNISRAFVEACLDTLSISIKTRLILFKLFEKHVLKQLGHIYADANRTLVDTGILPKVPRHLPNTSGSHQRHKDRGDDDNKQAVEPPSSAPPASPAPMANAIMLSPEALASLMMAIRGAAGPSTKSHYSAYAKNPGPVLDPQDLASSLTSKQPIVDNNIARSQPKVVLRDLVEELLAKSNPGAPKALAQPEEDIINLVAIFFDKILEDPDLPNALQSLVCRLQIPILKAALKNPTFLTDEEHAARKLINAIVRVGMTFDSSKPLERDPLYCVIADGVQTINRQYFVDDGIFSIVESQIEELLKKESRKSHIIENRTTQTEMGKAKIRNAKAFAQSTLFNKLKSESLPDRISDFLTNTWLQVLVITFIKEGKEGAMWVENEQLISDLVWLCQSHQDERSKRRAQRLKPEILKRIDKGLELAIDNIDTRHEKIAEIEHTISCIIGDETFNSVHFRMLDSTQMETLGKADNTEKSWSEMSALERQQSQHQELSGKFYLEAKNIDEGTWIEYLDESDKPIRCKLSKKIDSDTYIFVNRFGLKILEKSRRQFAYDMQFNKVKVIDDTPIFDRIMARILSRFKDSKVT